MSKKELVKLSEKIREIEKVVLTFVGRTFIKYVMFGALIPVKVYNQEGLKDKSFILCPNHLGEKDKFYFWAHFDNNCSIAKKEFFQTKTFFQKIRTHVFKLMDAIPVDRKSVPASTFHGVEKFFEKKGEEGKNAICVIYPQGTISDFLTHQNEDTIKPGPFALASKLNVPIIPAYQEQLRFFRPSVIVYGNPIYVNLNEEKDIEEIDKNVINDENSKKMRKRQLIYLKYCKLWLEEMNRLHKKAEILAGRPIRKPVLNLKHQKADEEAAKRKKIKKAKQKKLNLNVNVNNI